MSEIHSLTHTEIWGDSFSVHSIEFGFFVTHTDVFNVIQAIDSV